MAIKSDEIRTRYTKMLDFTTSLTLDAAARLSSDYVESEDTVRCPKCGCNLLEEVENGEPV